ncbi:MAG TPA: methionyl-tRNA formyltransferase [Sedimentisphaerales bacterium]|nr:methionyl-tRNA formyltransferase [Sedimentisphaerales bacterium]
MKIVYLGSGQFGLGCLDALAGSNHSLRLVVTQPANPAGRGRKPKPTPVAQWAGAHSAAFVETDNANAPQVIEQIAGYGPDVIVVIAFGQKIGPDLIKLGAKGAINVHASLLPKYRGAAPINWAIINGETQTGISIITLAEKMDAGQILAQSQVDIEPDETAGQLHDKLAGSGAPLLINTLDRIAAGTAVYIDQDNSKATPAPKLKKSDGCLDFAESGQTIARKIRGFWPWPGASATYISKQTGKSERVIIAMAQEMQTQNTAGLAPGTLDENMEVICGTNSLKITKITPAGSPLMSFKAFVNGRQTKPGDMFVAIDR